MSFRTDNAWPAGLRVIFEYARTKRAPFEHRYFGPYDKLLNYCFGNDFTFYVAPQNPFFLDSRDAVEPFVFFVVFDSNHKPVFILEVKDEIWAQNAQLRYEADKHMRDRYALMLDESPSPRFWGLSVLGTSMRVYCGSNITYEVTPPHIPRSEPSRVLPPSFLAGEWDVDVMSQEGFEKMKEIVTDIFTQTGKV